MGELGGVPFVSVEYNKFGAIHDPAQVAALVQQARPDACTDLLVLCHGWNNDEAEARLLYSEWLRSIREQRGTRLPGAKLAAVGLHWPSKKFADADLIPGGGAASLDDVQDDGVLLEQLQGLAGFFDADGADATLAELAALTTELHQPSKQAAFVERLSTLVGDSSEDDEPGSQQFSTDDPRALFETFEAPIQFVPDDVDGGGAAGGVGGMGGMGDGQHNGGAAGLLSNLLVGPVAAARRLLNLVTYYQMKHRAGMVGGDGIVHTLRAVRQAHPNLRLHLVGHSFGARALTAACSAATDLEVESLILLQAAFSHNGFAEDFRGGRDGAFRNVLTSERVRGPILISHTRNDMAVGIMYALASKLSRQDAAALVGGASDRFGGLGANGTQFTPGAVQARLTATGTTYDFAQGTLYNLRADDFISGHGDVSGAEVGNAIVAGMAVTAT